MKDLTRMAFISLSFASNTTHEMRNLIFWRRPKVPHLVKVNDDQ
jgi:hypothetical protein